MRSKEMSRWQFLKGIAGVAVLVLFSSSLFLSRGQELIKVGVIDSFSGSFRPIANYGRIGYEMARDRINAAGGINGKQIELIFADDAGDPGNALALTEKLILIDGVDWLSGGTSGDSALAISALAEDLETLFILGTGAETADLVGRFCNQFTFMPYNNALSQAQALAPFIVSQGINQVIALNANPRSVDAESVLRAFKGKFEALGGKVETEMSLSQGSSNGGLTDLAKAAETTPNILLIGSGTEGLAQAYRSITTLSGNITVNVFGIGSVADVAVLSEGADFDDFKTRIKDESIKIHAVTRFPALPEIDGTPLGTSAMSKFIVDFQTRNGKEGLPSQYTQSAFNALMVFKSAAEAVGYQGRQDISKVIDWLEGAGEQSSQDDRFNPGSEPGRLFQEGDDFPQGPVFLRQGDHAGFVRQFIARVVRVADGGAGLLVHKFVAETIPGNYWAQDAGCQR